MEKFQLEKDVNVFYVTATSFPEGIASADKKIHELAPLNSKRRFFGISWPVDGVVVYKSAAEEMEPGEAEKTGCESFIIRRGEYSCITVKDFLRDINQIDRAFKELLSQPNIDPQGYCLEWYLNDTDVRCMVPLES